MHPERGLAIGQKTFTPDQPNQINHDISGSGLCSSGVKLALPRTTAVATSKAADQKASASEGAWRKWFRGGSDLGWT